MSPQTLAEATREDLSRAYEAAQGPFAVAVPGQPDFIVMRTSDIPIDRTRLTDAEKQSLIAGYDDYLNGNVLDAEQAIVELRERYGL